MSRYATPYDAVMSQYGQPSFAQRRLDAAKKHGITHLIEQFERERDAMLIMQQAGEPVSDGRLVHPMYDIIHPELKGDGILYYFVMSDEEIEGEVILMAGAWYFEGLGTGQLNQLLKPSIQDAIYRLVWNKRRRDDLTLFYKAEEDVEPEELSRWKELQAQFKGEAPQNETEN